MPSQYKKALKSFVNNHLKFNENSEISRMELFAIFKQFCKSKFSDIDTDLFNYYSFTKSIKNFKLDKFNIYDDYLCTDVTICRYNVVGFEYNINGVIEELKDISEYVRNRQKGIGNMVKKVEAQAVFNDFSQCLKAGGENTYTRMELYGIYEQFNEIMSENPDKTKYHRTTFNSKISQLGIPYDCITKNTEYRGYDREYKEYLYHCDIVNFEYSQERLINSVSTYKNENIMSKFKKNPAKILEDLKKNGPVKIIQPAQDKVSETKAVSKSANNLYSESRKYEDFHAKGDNESVFLFMEDGNYSRCFGKEEYMEFKKFYIDYLKYCTKKGYIPISRCGFRNIMEEHTYVIEKRGGTLYININNANKKQTLVQFVPAKPVKKEEPVQEIKEENTNAVLVEPVALDMVGEVRVFNFKFKTIEKPDMPNDQLQKIDHFVRDNFIRKYTQYDEDGKASYDTKKLYASFKYYTKDKDITFNQFRYVISHIPAARLNTSPDFTTEHSALIPEFYFLAHMHDKHVDNGIPITIGNYEKRVVKAKAEIIKVYEDLKKNNGFDDPEIAEIVEPIVEEKKEEEIVVPEPVQAEKPVAPAKPKVVSMEHVYQNKVEVMNKALYETDNEAFESVDSAMQSIENDYAGVIRKYKALEDIKQVIKEERIKVHADLKPIFDMLVTNALQKFESINPTFPSFQKEVDELKSNLRNLSSFVKRA